MNFAFSTIFYLLVAHFVGDFFLQSQKVAEKKSSNFWYLLFHCEIYFITLLFASPAIFQGYSGKLIFSEVHFWFASVSTILHFIVDMISSMFYSLSIRSEGGFKRGFFNTLGVDQFVHIILLFFLVGAMGLSNF